MQLPWQQQQSFEGGDGTPRYRPVERDGSAPSSSIHYDRTESVQDSQWSATKWPSPTTLALALAVISLLLTAHSWGGQSYITEGMLWMREHEQQGRVLFVVAYTACLLLLLPASVLALLAGACFGLLWGVALVYCANIIGQTLAFLLARSFLHDRLYTLVTSHWTQFTSIDAALRREGWRLVFVLRLSPCVPFVLLNYALGLTSISFLEYSLASAVAIIPFVVISVYLGLASGAALQLLESARWPDRPDRADKAIEQQAGAHKFLSLTPPSRGHFNAALGTAAATAELTGMNVDADASGPGASTTLVTAATCILAVVTGVYAAWFIRRVTSEVLEEEMCDKGGATGGLAALNLFAESSTDMHQLALQRGMPGAAGAPPHTPSAPCMSQRAERHDTGKGVAAWQSLALAARGLLQAAVPCDASQAVNGEGDQLAQAPGRGSGRYSRDASGREASGREASGREASVGLSSSLQQRWPRWPASLTTNFAHAARAAVGASGLPVVQPGTPHSVESGQELIGLEKR